MSEHTITKTTFTGMMLLSALTAGAMTATGLGSAPAANATCASFFGIGNSADCTSSATSIAIAIGNNVTASAQGLFGAAIALGDGAQASTTPLGTGVISAFNTAVAVGFGGVRPSDALANGILSLAVSVGKYANASTGGLSPMEVGNVALNLFGTFTNTNGANANGFGTLALSAFSNGFSETVPHTADVTVQGILSSAIALFGTNNKVSVSGPTTTDVFNPGLFSLAFNAFGSNNQVYATDPGRFAVAGAIGQNGVTVEQQAPGVNIYTRVALGAAATGAKAAASTANANTSVTARSHRSPRATAATSSKR